MVTLCVKKVEWPRQHPASYVRCVTSDDELLHTVTACTRFAVLRCATLSLWFTRRAICITHFTLGCSGSGSSSRGERLDSRGSRK